MVCKRRILSFPVIRPCESVAFSTLLASVIDIGRLICGYKSVTLYSNKKNARNSIRLIESIVILLEEIQKGSSRIEDSLDLSLSELHCIFQKVRFLLEDCTRDDARLLMLVKSEKVSSHFVEVMRAISVAMDVMHLEGLDVEVKEFAEFVRKRLLKAEVDVERVDRRFMRKVVGVFSKFESGMAPDSIDLRSVLEYLRIRSWNDCHIEVRFLESEIEHECSTAEKRDAGFLSSLKAFLIFCRCCLFVTMDSVSYGLVVQSGGGLPSVDVISGLNSDDFLCPITLEIMSDPVTISTGHTYDRPSILKWFRSGNRTCPKTGRRVLCTDLIPNLSLKQLAKEYCSGNGIPFSESDASVRDMANASLTGSRSLAAAQAMSLLANFLAGRLLAGTIQEQQKAAYEIRLLTKSSTFNRSCFVEVKATIPSLLNLVCLGNPGAQENAMAALLNLSKYPQTKKILVENDGLNLVVDVLKEGINIEARQYAAGALFYLSSVEDYRREIGKIPGAIPGLIYLLKNGAERGKKNALLAIWVLLLCHKNHFKFLESGVVPLLINVLTSSDREKLTAHSLAVLAALAENFDGSVAIISAGSLPIIIEVLDSSDSRTAKEYCVSLLLSLCMNAEANVVPLLVKNPSVIASLYSLLTHGTAPSSNKAGSLIGILHAFKEKSSLGSMASALPQEQLVRVR